MGNASLDSAYFDRLYAQKSDPWDFETSAYEAGKYARTIAALGERHFGRALEIGCSIGVLTARLAPLCDELLAVDVSDAALDAARARCREVANVRFERASIPHAFPAGPFDLIVVSEVAYYWSDADLALAIDRIAAAGRDGIVELVHFLPAVDEYVRDGDAVHAAFLADPRFAREHAERAERYRIDVLRVR